jgi:hypothetical protein
MIALDDEPVLAGNSAFGDGANRLSAGVVS